MMDRSGGSVLRFGITLTALAVMALVLTGCFGGGGWPRFGSIDGFVYYHFDAKESGTARDAKPDLVVTRSRIAPSGYSPLQGAKVAAVGSGGTYITYSGSDGYFILTSVTPGVYEVSITHDRFIIGLRFSNVTVTAGVTRHLSDSVLGSFFYLIIGINDYPEYPLQYCVADAQAIKRSLWTTNGYAGKVILLTDAQASKDGIRTAIESIGSQMNKQDYFVMFFSGHGGYQADNSPDPPDDDPQEFLVAADNQVIDDDELTQWIWSNIPTDYCLFIFDSCHSGGMVKSADTAVAPSWMKGYRPGLSGLARDLNQDGYVVIMACDDNETSKEDPGLGQGVFTYYFCRGIDTRDADFNPADGLITAREIYNYTRPRVMNHVAGKGWTSQTPQLYASPAERADIPVYRVP
ncbi:MAG: caspase family protein [Bacillota bacterium]